MASSAAVEHEQAEELEDCVTYQHVKLLESAGIGECLFIFFPGFNNLDCICCHQVSCSKVKTYLAKFLISTDRT